METKEKKVHRVFEAISKDYDFMNSVISFQRHKAWRKDTMKRMKVQVGTKALDVCCGTADWTLALAEAVGPTGSVVGLDFSENMLAIGKEKVKDSQMNNITLIHGNAMELPFEDGTFDYVTIGFGLRNVPDYLHVLKEMYRVLKPGGMVVCLETSQPTMPVFKQGFTFYFRYVMPILGKLLAKSYNEYSWLQESANDFPGREQLKGLFIQAGFKNIKIKSYSGGVAAMHLGRK
ncbi:bifunctional demethylmenaquinone methyltransferase/2-methoxy-6-polyprenyl-1,4-benzoquinol methylase [Lottiidibacillus patelloidae]|uniref:Demethylmenaquinone methyltransferase n=1 Tax=Lottiidibacillus patelloidae TaxID=2670334 RepID=A0A263BU49_9BACI|nr:demethylmenaquinone methyltransferase [Lottiidibacillus patelloidae]OZM57271.1 bifunctional demethylmenaquinone methyltransferase/2-methoxy-6-polyprenyl-1,4-benzoquinol methylase [Lottiidibacillus patelloidae]